MLVKNLRNRACEDELTLKLIFETEKLILNKISFKVHLFTSFELQNMIFEYLNVNDTDLFQSTSIWINFALNEYRIYKKFDQFTLSISCIMIALKSKEYENQIECLKNYINESNLKLEAFQNCINDIYELITEEETNCIGNETTQDNTDMSSEENQILLKNPLGEITSQVKNQENDTELFNYFLSKKKNKTNRIKKRKSLISNLTCETSEKLSLKKTIKIKQTKMSDFVKKQKIFKNENQK